MKIQISKGWMLLATKTKIRQTVGGGNTTTLFFPAAEPAAAPTSATATSGLEVANPTTMESHLFVYGPGTRAVVSPVLPDDHIASVCDHHRRLTPRSYPQRHPPERPLGHDRSAMPLSPQVRGLLGAGNDPKENASETCGYPALVSTVYPGSMSAARCDQGATQVLAALRRLGEVVYSSGSTQQHASGYGMDIALIEIRGPSRYLAPGTGSQPTNFQLPSRKILEEADELEFLDEYAKPKDMVLKVGRATGTTMGHYGSLSADVSMEKQDGSGEFFRSIEDIVTSCEEPGVFARHGNSGCPVLDHDAGIKVMHWGGLKRPKVEGSAILEGISVMIATNIGEDNVQADLV
ncbi:uncharacterized protein E0L32_010894 [Thyridium curvatum]|uniref:Uncharacterized protein n=1 Tax=Thyridium curvatum TaxID=1093900 RepID=A0A507AQR4_9PEZI|nr:uncharacterized protein E0L32_010894 [Thyridium curvatum]TPX07191.1 hypothetical protein E0L32_010894 [Thyridium curvatum]